MRKLPLVLFLLAGVVAGYAIYSSQGDVPVEAARPAVQASLFDSVTPELEQLQSPERRSSLEDPASASKDATAEGSLDAMDEVPPKPAEFAAEVDPLADWTGPWSKDLEQSRRVVLDVTSTLDERAGALKYLGILGERGEDDPRTEEIVLEAAWILANTSDVGVLDDVLDGLEDIQHEALVEPLVSLLINHGDAKVRKWAAEVLLGYEDDKRASTALQHAAQYDENQEVRWAASGE